MYIYTHMYERVPMSQYMIGLYIYIYVCVDVLLRVFSFIPLCIRSLRRARLHTWMYIKNRYMNNKHSIYIYIGIYKEGDVQLCAYVYTQLLGGTRRRSWKHEV